MQDFNNHRDWKRGWSYENDAPDDEQWQLDRDWLFSLSGNGWWWGWKFANPKARPIDLWDGEKFELRKDKQI